MTRPTAKYYLRWHAIVLAGGLLLMVLSHWLGFSAGWFFWLGLAWSMLWVAHYCIVKSVYVDEDWVEERARDLRFKSYDLGHINKIRGHYIKRPKKRS